MVKKLDAIKNYEIAESGNTGSCHWYGIAKHCGGLTAQRHNNALVSRLKTVQGTFLNVTISGADRIETAANTLSTIRKSKLGYTSGEGWLQPLSA